MPGDEKPSPGLQWPVMVYYDPPQPQGMAATMAAANMPAMLMTFHGKVTGVPAVIALDTQASHCFLSKSFAQQHGLVTYPANTVVVLADGTNAHLDAECVIRLQFKAQGKNKLYHRRVKCYVIDMSTEQDILLGQDWLLKEGVRLDYVAKEVTLRKQGIILKPRRDAPQRDLPVLSAIQAKRHLRKAANFFMVQVTESRQEKPSEQLTFAQQIPDTVSPEVRRLLLKHQDVFGTRQGLPPDRGISHVIVEEPGSRPVYRPPYRLSPLEQQELEKQIKDLLLKGFIEPSTSPYGAPVLFVTKKDGSLRMCCDWRKLNAQTVKARYPLPNVNQLLDRLHGAKWFTSLDLQSGYHQIRIKEEDVPKTAFTTPFGHYQWKVLSFGLCNAPATFQAVMNGVFQPLINKGVLVYMDDILIYAKTKEEHDALLSQVLQILQDKDMFAKLSKCEFEQKELKFLGHIVGEEGIKVDPVKTTVVENWPVPRTVKDVRAFLGLANYFRRFLQGFSVLTAPLTELTRAKVQWNWTPECQQAYEAVKHALTHAPVLALPNYDDPTGFEVLCDASIVGIGAVLTQHGKPIAFESRKLTDAERKWMTTDQELWAVVHALKQWRCYLEGIPFTVVTDHNPLVHLQTQPNLSRRQARWAEYLQRFNFAWTYRPGRTNVADPLSRVPHEPRAPLVLNAITLKAMTMQTRARKRANAQPASKVQRPPSGTNRTPPGKTPARQRGQQTNAGAAAPRTTRRSGVGKRTAPAQHHAEVLPAAQAHGQTQGLQAELQRGYADDDWFANPQNVADLQFQDGLWWKGDRVAVPDAPGLRRSVLHELHDAPFSGHPGVAKTLKAVERWYWWPTWRADVKHYVDTCISCQRNKPSNQPPYGLLNPLPIPDRPWGSVGVDFIVGLPEIRFDSGETSYYDSICVFVDRLTKMVHLAPTNEKVTAEGTAWLLMDKVFSQHGVPDTVISDRGPVFTSAMLEEFFRIMGTQHKCTTAYHPQSDGQTERVNRVLGDMLRHYAGMQHKEWHRYLPAAEFAVNNAFHESIGTTPFKLNGRLPHIPLMRPPAKEPSAASYADRMIEGLQAAKRCLRAAQDRQKLYYDNHHRQLILGAGDKVWLSTKNLRLAYRNAETSSRKLMPKFLGPFEVEAKVGHDAYKLRLPPAWKIHPIFHVSLLKLYKHDPERVQPPPEPVVVDGAAEFFIDRIVSHTENQRTGKRMFRVRWRGYPPEWDDTLDEDAVQDTEAYTDYIRKAGISPRVHDSDDDE